MKNRVFNLFTLFALLVSFVGSLTSVTPAYAAGIVVNTAVDEDVDNGTCSLREAITAANTNAAYGGCPAGAGSDAITFAGNYTITLSSQLPSVTTVITITGNGAANTIVQANAAANTATYRVFEVGAAGNMTLDSLTVRHGRCNGSCATITNVGGGILNDGTLTVTNSTLSDNSASNGGGIMTNGPLTVTNSTLSGNSVTSEGGGIYNNGSTATLTNSTLSGNSAGSQGGGISNFGTATLTNSTLSNNSASSNGGGIINFSTLTVTNSTFSGNSTANNGGGIYNDGSSPTLTNVTFSGNSANANGGGMLNTGVGSSPTLKNVILANSITGGDCINIEGASLNAASSNNLIESTEGGACGLTDNVSGNIIGSADPALGPLADNGGPTQTHALLTSSPAISTGTNTGCPSTDQRGVARPQFLVCDIGAVESNVQQDSTLIVNTAEDSNDGFCDLFVAGITDCTLREAINYANSVAGTWTITFASNYTITLGSQLPAVTGTIIINGNGAANTIIQANVAPNTANYRVFLVNPGSLTLNQVTVRHGVSSGVGGGIYVLSGTLAINNSLISANDLFDGGGGVYNSLSDVTITNSTFADNTSSNAGAALTNQGTMTISNSTISNNAATGTNNYAGGIRNLSTLNIYNSTISGNTSTSAVFDGSNIAQDGGTLNLRNTIIANGTDGDCAITGGTLGINANNLIEDASSACGMTNGVNGNIIGSDPALGSLTGSPAYFPLNSGSPAIDAGNNAICAAAPVNNQSQNGITRPAGSACDIGSVEMLATIDVTIGGVNRGTYNIAQGASQRVNYAGLDAGPVVVDATNDVPIIAALRDAYYVNGQVESFVQLMGLPEAQISTKYYFPAYNNVTLDGQLRFGNVGNSNTTVTVTIAGVVRGTYDLTPGQAKRVNYTGLDAGPVIVESSGGVPIIAALRDAYFVNGQIESFAQLMGLPSSQLSDTYYFPAYNNVTLNEQLRIGNVDTVPTTVTVTIAGVVRGTYPLDPNEAVRINYAGLDAGPVVVQSSGGAKIIAALRDAYFVNGQVTSFVQLMGLPLGQLSTKYYFPAYNNVTLDGQLRFGNVGNSNTTVTVTIGGVVRGTYNLTPGQAQRVNYTGLDAGPVVVESSGGVPIIAALRDAYFVNGLLESFAQLMGLPDTALSPTYYFPAYNNVTLNGQLRFGVP